MESPVCVVDAETFIDRIHLIKRWIYNGQLRLVVPSTTYENVEQIYQKSKEAKPATKEPTRPKQSGKPAKKEYPTFDINPKLARDFLVRLKTWKETEGLSEQSEFFQEKENHQAVSFQQANEQYNPWKDVDVEEEKPQVTEDRPTTWAEALRRKQNLASGANGTSQAQKGPVKPKLVAKSAASDPSPWKMKRDAPKISAKDVPGKLRPLMSCALWRLHESIDRNDANELFLLTNHSEIRKVALKLNIITRSTEELGILVTAKAKQVDLEVFGDLEREFNIQPKAPKQVNSVPFSQIGDSSSSFDTASVVAEQDFDKGNKIPDGGKPVTNLDDVSSDRAEATNTESTEDSNPHVRSESKIEEAGMRDRLSKSNESEDRGLAASTLGTHPGDADPGTYSSSNGHRVGFLPINGLSSGLHTTDGLQSSSSSINNSQNMAIAEDTPAGAASSPATVSDSDKLNSDNKTPVQVYSSNIKTPLPTASQPTSLGQEPEDSDEEVVVFVPQPKRFSNQKKPTQQQTSRPSTPVTQPPKQISRKSSPVAPQNQTKLPNRGRHANVINHGHPHVPSAPVIIDPDAFGRSFAVNPSPSPRNLPKPRSHHRLRRSVENAQALKSPLNGNQPNPRTSPSRQLFQDKPRRDIPEPEPKPARGQSTHSHPVARTSPRMKLSQPESKAPAPEVQGPSEVKPVVEPRPKSLISRMVESEEFVPRTGYTESPFGAIGTPPTAAESQNPTTRTTNATRKPIATTTEPRFVDPNNFVPRDFEPINQSKSRAIHAKAVEADDFVPRSPTHKRRSLRSTPEPEVIEPRASMPDVQYVLKSGSTRAATRGRGRLWVPT